MNFRFILNNVLVCMSVWTRKKCESCLLQSPECLNVNVWEAFLFYIFFPPQSKFSDFSYAVSRTEYFYLF